MDKIISARIFLLHYPILNISVGYTALIVYFDEAFVEKLRNTKIGFKEKDEISNMKKDMLRN